MSQTTQLSGESFAFLDLMDQISRAAGQERSLLVIGERGTGKELIAERLHFLSRRWNGAFVKMNCAALPETLLESELFGYEPGAFTGATKRRIGRFERADQGTLFLDEIGTMSHAAQEKLLRVIEYGEFERVGGSKTLTIDVRVIGATNIDLPGAADAGLFRHDLLDRLAFDVITIPPLSARPEDIMVLAEEFGRAMAHEQEWPFFPGFTEEARILLQNHTWPGNIRELKNVVERAVYRAWDAEGPISEIILDPFDSPFRPTHISFSGSHMPQIRDTGAGAARRKNDTVPKTNQHPFQPDSEFIPVTEGLKDQVAALEKNLLAKSMKDNDQNQRKAAKALQLSYDQIRHLLKKHRLI